MALPANINTVGQYGTADRGGDTRAYLDAMPYTPGNLFWVQTSPGHTEPLSDRGQVFTIRHPAIGDLKTASGRVLMANTTLDTAIAAFPEGTVITACL